MGQCSSTAQRQMQLDSPLSPLKVSTDKHHQAEINDGRIEIDQFIRGPILFQNLIWTRVVKNVSTLGFLKILRFHENKIIIATYADSKEWH